MPELPEVETVRRILDRVLTGHVLKEVEVADDSILLSKVPHTLLQDHLLGQRVTGTGRRGKFFWIELEKRPWLFGHLGMAGWIRELGAPTIRLKEHGEAPLDDENGRPRFLKWMLTADTGRRVAMTDGRRLGRLWMNESPEVDLRIQRLGPDCYTDLPDADFYLAKFKKKTAPMKAILLDQTLFCGVGNWIADEVLYHARISPARLGKDVSRSEIETLLKVLGGILEKSVSVGADSAHFPEDWLFHVRWGGSKGTEHIAGQSIIREQIGGRTTAWVPTLQN